MDNLMKKFNEKMDKTISILKEDLNTVRAGRANAAILDNTPYHLATTQY